MINTNNNRNSNGVGQNQLNPYWFLSDFWKEIIISSGNGNEFLSAVFCAKRQDLVLSYTDNLFDTLYTCINSSTSKPKVVHNIRFMIPRSAGRLNELKPSETKEQ